MNINKKITTKETDDLKCFYRDFMAFLPPKNARYYSKYNTRQGKILFVETKDSDSQQNVMRQLMLSAQNKDYATCFAVIGKVTLSLMNFETLQVYDRNKSIVTFKINFLNKLKKFNVNAPEKETRSTCKSICYFLMIAKKKIKLLYLRNMQNSI